MVHQDLELVRSAYAAWDRDDLDALLALLDDSLEWTPVFGAAGLAATTYRGHAGFLDWEREARETLGRVNVEAQEFREGATGIVVPVRVTGRGAGSGVEIDQHSFHVWRTAGGKITELRSFGRESEALEAVGLGRQAPSM